MNRRMFWLAAFFIIGIVLPGGFLSYLGFRSFHYEQRVLNQQAADRQTTIINGLDRNATQMLRDLLTPLFQVAGSEAMKKGSRLSLARQLSALKTIHGAAVQDLYIIDRNEDLRWPVQSERDRHSGTLGVGSPLRSLNWGIHRTEIERLEALEFETGRVDDALRGYEALQRKPLSRDLQAALVKMIAAAYRKQGRPEEAERHYRRMISDFDEVPDVTGLPMGILALQLLARLYESTQREALASAARVDMLEGLLNDRWLLKPSARASLVAQTRAALSIQNHADSQSRQQTLELLDADLARRAPRAIDFARDTWPALLKRLRKRGTLERGDILWQAGRQGEPPSTFLLTVPLWDQQSGARQGTLIAAVQAFPVLTSLTRMLRETVAADGLLATWSVATAEYPPAPPGWLSVQHRVLSVTDPPLLLQLQAPIHTGQEAFARHRVHIYTTMIALSFVMIIVGFAAFAISMKREVELASLKAQFVSNVSHQIRTPLYTISLIGERLAQGRYASPEEAQEFYAMLNEETKHLRGLVDDALDFSRMIDGKKMYDLARLDLREVARDAQERFSSRAKTAGFAMEMTLPDQPAYVEGDRSALVEAVLNLMDNAAKYSGLARWIAVRVTTADTAALLSVEDQGPGIPDEDQQKIFEKFYRRKETSQTASAGGVGLGLAIVKHIVEGHGGQVRVARREGSGSVFTLQLPLAEEPTS